MPYGRRKYGQINKNIPVSAIPTYVCGHCGHIGSMDMPFTEITATDKKGLLAYIKICITCTKLFQEWAGK
jgi:hypothetical protein